MFSVVETPLARLDASSARPLTWTIARDRSVCSNTDAWRPTKRQKSDAGSDSDASAEGSARGGETGGGVELANGASIAWTIEESTSEIVVIRSSSGWATRVIAPSAFCDACVATLTSSGRVVVAAATRDGEYVMRIAFDAGSDDCDDLESRTSVEVTRNPMSSATRIAALGAVGSDAFILFDVSGAGVVLHAETMMVICEIQSSSTISRVWNAVKGSSESEIVSASTRSARVSGKDYVAALSSDGFVQVWDVTDTCRASEQLTSGAISRPPSAIKASRVCASHLPLVPGTRDIAPGDRAASAFAIAPSANNLTLNVLVSARDNPHAQAPQLALYKMKHGALVFTSSIEGSQGVVRALGLTGEFIIAALESPSGARTMSCWPLDALHRARSVRSGDSEASALEDWGHSGGGNDAAMELIKRFGALNGYSVESVARALANEVSLRGLDSDEALYDVRTALGIDEAPGSNLCDVLFAASSGTPTSVVETWCRAASAYAKGWHRAHAPLSFIPGSTGPILVRSGGVLGVIRLNNEIEDSLVRARIMNEDAPTLKFHAGGRQTAAALDALFERLNAVLGTAACAAMDLVASGLCVDTDHGALFDNLDEQVEAASQNSKDWLASFAGALIGDIFPPVRSDESESQSRARKASHRARQRIIVRLLQDALGSIPDPERALQERVDAWALGVTDLGDVSEEAHEGAEKQRHALVLNAARQQARARLTAARGLVLLLGCVRLGPKIGFSSVAADSVASVLPRAMRAYRSAILSAWLLTERRSCSSIGKMNAPRLAMILVNMRHEIIDAYADGASLRRAGAVVDAVLTNGTAEEPSQVQRVIEIGTALYAAGEIDALGTLLAFARQQVPGND